MGLSEIMKVVGDYGIMPALLIYMIINQSKVIDRQCASWEALSKEISLIKADVLDIKNNISDIKGKIK